MYYQDKKWTVWIQKYSELKWSRVIFSKNSEIQLRMIIHLVRRICVSDKHTDTVCITE